MALQPEDYKLIIDALQVIATTGVVIIAANLSIKSGKIQKSFSISIDKMIELHTKIHDRMIDAIDLMKKNQPFDERLQKRMRMCASRFSLFDDKKTIVRDVETFINGWETSLHLHEQGNYTEATLSRSRDKFIRLSIKIRDNIDSLLKPFLKD